MSDDLREKVCRAIYDEMEGPVADQDARRQRLQWELCLRLATAAIAAVRAWDAAQPDEFATLKAELAKRGDHTTDCPWRGGRTCDCGWEELKRRVSAPEKENEGG